MNVRRIGLLAGVLILVAVGTVQVTGQAQRLLPSRAVGDVTVGSAGTVPSGPPQPAHLLGRQAVRASRRAPRSPLPTALWHVGGGSRVRFARLKDQQGEDDDFSAVDLKYGSVVLAASRLEDSAPPRVDTDDATVYLTAGARARVNFDDRHGTVVVARYGSAEVRTRTGSFTVKAGSYLEVLGDEQPELARGSFSSHRFDI
jgi:hypothetical protein